MVKLTCETHDLTSATPPVHYTNVVPSVPQCDVAWGRGSNDTMDDMHSHNNTRVGANK